MRTARCRMSRNARRPVRSDASASALPGQRTEPPGARFASMKSSMLCAVMSQTGTEPKKGTRCFSVKER